MGLIFAAELMQSIPRSLIYPLPINLPLLATIATPRASEESGREKCIPER
jgi:hypothetical protein